MGNELFNSALSKPAPSFFIHIFRIVLKCSYKQMVRICAFWVITFMKNIHSQWNWAKMNFPRSAVSSNFFMWFYTALNQPISKRVFCCIPFPTIISFFHFQPKAEFKRSARFVFYRHKQIMPIFLGDYNGQR